MKRIRAAFHTNEAQVNAVVLLTMLNLAACAFRPDGAPWGLWLIAGLFWPVLAFVFNLLDPIEKE